MAETRLLDLEDLRVITEGVELPNFTAEVYADEFLGPYLRLVGTVQDTRFPEQTIDLGINSRIPPCHTDEQYLDWFLHRWVEIWVHEAREMFKYNGELYSDPHGQDS